MKKKFPMFRKLDGTIVAEGDYSQEAAMMNICSVCNGM